MKTLLVGINAKFIHSNLAIRYMEKYAARRGVSVATAEFTINQSIDLIMDHIMDAYPDVVGFSCYLWNIEMVRQLAMMIKQVRPKVKILFGGPEVSYDSELLMSSDMAVDYVISGEGEVSTTALIEALSKGLSLDHVPGLTYRQESKVVKNLAGHPMAMAEVPFVYEDDLSSLANKIIYYETSRGCPYKCQYCLSSIEKGVRFRPIEMVKEELQFFLDHQVPQVKFVDRTFNANKKHTWAIWHYLHEHDNGVTNFHFEITADLLDDATIEFLTKVRPGLFQFEVGVQSTHEPTIITLERKVDFEKLKDKVIKVMVGGNIHMHLDLIAGLPKEDYPTFRQSFNDVMAIRPEQLQLGFLKVLKGSRIHQLQREYDITYRQFAPYEVLSTKEMSYEDLRRLKRIEEMLEVYYNSHQFETAIDYLTGLCSSPFDLFEGMADWWHEQGLFDMPHNKLKLYELLESYGSKVDYVDVPRLRNYLKHDLILREKPKKWPAFIQREEKVSPQARCFYQNEALRETLFANYEGMSAKQLTRMTHLECYEYDVLGDGEKSVRWLFYDYRDRDFMTGCGAVVNVTALVL